MPDEKDAMRAALSRAMVAPQTPRLSPYAFHWQVPQYALMSLLAVMLVGGGTVFASGNALPGDLLYPVKTQVTEQVLGAVQFSPASQVAWHAKLAERRATEAESLATEGRLTQESADLIASNVDSEVSAAATLIAETNSDTTHDASVPAAIGATLAAHSAILSAIGEGASTSPTGATAEDLAARISSQSRVLLAIGVPRRIHVTITAGTSTGATSIAAAPKGKGEPEAESVRVSLTMQASTSGSSTTPSSSPSQTVGVAATSSGKGIPSQAASSSGEVMLGAGDLADMRSQALSAIVKVKTTQGKSKGKDSRAASLQSQVDEVIAEAEAAVTHADSIAQSDDIEAFKSYRRALLLSVSLNTILHAETSLSGNAIPNLLPSLEVSGSAD
jgi:hypothetical protein